MHAIAEGGETTAGVLKYRGEVVYLFAFDVAYDTSRQPLKSLMGQPVAEFIIDSRKRAPRQLFFYRPQMIRLPARAAGLVFGSDASGVNRLGDRLSSDAMQGPGRRPPLRGLSAGAGRR